jgi:hypothetical protein
MSRAGSRSIARYHRPTAVKPSRTWRAAAARRPFGPVALDATPWWVLDAFDAAGLARLRAAAGALGEESGGDLKHTVDRGPLISDTTAHVIIREIVKSTTRNEAGPQRVRTRRRAVRSAADDFDRGRVPTVVTSVALVEARPVQVRRLRRQDQTFTFL